MSAFSIRCQTAKAVRAGFAFSVASAMGLCAGGCANSNGAYYSGSAPAAYVAQGPSVPIESDGLPVQAAPPSSIRQMPDDPTQPYSPNYGGSNPASTIPSQPTVKASNDVAPSVRAIPDDLPPTFRRQLAAAVDAAG
jgi:hypothetical protein